MNGKIHPLTGATYELGEDGYVRVVATTGESGLFTVEGVWASGTLHEADPHLCGWVGGPRVPDPAKAGVAGSSAAKEAGSR